jgi:hypothetical protein
MAGFQQRYEIILKLTREFGDRLSGLRTDNHHFSHMWFGPAVRLDVSPFLAGWEDRSLPGNHSRLDIASRIFGSTSGVDQGLVSALAA